MLSQKSLIQKNLILVFACLCVSQTSRSRTEFISKITIVQEEADETLYWLELINETGIVRSESINGLMKEADELTAIFTSSTKTAKTNLYNLKSKS